MPTEAFYDGQQDYLAKLNSMWGQSALGLRTDLAASGGSELMGHSYPEAPAYLKTVSDILNGEEVSLNRFLSDVQIADVQAGTLLRDVTAAIIDAHGSGVAHLRYQPGKYLITMVEGTPLVSLAARSGVSVIGHSATLYDSRVYTNPAVLSPVFEFNACNDVKIIGLDYKGLPVASPSDPVNGVGYLGATFVNLKNGCENIMVAAKLVDLRYGVRSGDYATPADGYNKNLRIRLKTLRCGYPQAHYLAEDLKADIYAEFSHRSSYLAGVKGFDVNVRFKNQYLAPIQVLLTDATTNGNAYPTGSSRGCSAGRVWAQDMGSTSFVANSWAAGISLSRVDPGTIFEDIGVHVHVVASDTVASTVGAFVLNSAANVYQPSYPFNWEQTIALKDIRVSGLVDRSAQTIATHGVGEFYVGAVDTGTHFATVSGFDVDGLRIINGAGANPHPLYFQVPGLVGPANFSRCDFGNYQLEFKSNTVSPINFNDCAPIVSTSVNSSDDGAVDFSNTGVTSLLQPMLNASFQNSPFMGAVMRDRTVVRDIALAGASVSMVGIIPPGALLLGVSGKLKSTITGASGFQVGVAGDLTRFADQALVAIGSAFTPQQSAATEVGARFYRVYTDLVVTAKTANFTGGVMRLAVHYLSFTPPA